MIFGIQTFFFSFFWVWGALDNNNNNGYFSKCYFFTECQDVEFLLTR